ncbi:MAG: hypothetical protein QXW26_04755 [Candidatus Nitrosocaldus sp.]
MTAIDELELERKAAIANTVLFSLLSVNVELTEKQKADLGAYVVQYCAKLFNIDKKVLFQKMKEQSLEGIKIAHKICHAFNSIHDSIE